MLNVMKLFNAMSGYANGVEKKAVMNAFAWQNKVHPYDHMSQAHWLMHSRS